MDKRTITTQLWRITAVLRRERVTKIKSEKIQKLPINKSASISGIWRFNKILKYLTSHKTCEIWNPLNNLFLGKFNRQWILRTFPRSFDEVLSACHCLSTLQGVEISDWLENEASLAPLTHYWHSDVITSLTFIWSWEENKKWHSKGMVCSINPCLLTGRGDRGDSHTETSLQAPAPAPRVKVTAAIGRGRGQSPWHSAEYASSTPPTLTVISVILTSSLDNCPIWGRGWSTITNPSRGNTRPGTPSTLHQCKCHGKRQDSEQMRSQHQRQPTNEMSVYRTRGPASGGQSEASMKVTWSASTNRRPVFRARPRIQADYLELGRGPDTAWTERSVQWTEQSCQVIAENKWNIDCTAHNATMNTQ